MISRINRRAALATLGGASLSACAQNSDAGKFSSRRDAAKGVFMHGVASGDPRPRSVIIWTRITPENPLILEQTVTWEVSLSRDFADILSSGDFQTFAARDWTVKINVQNLEPGTDYFYRFQTDIYASQIGKTRTAPEGEAKQARFAIVSCSNWQQGYFNVYDHIARQDHFDALLHLGDYLYEYGADKVLGTEYGDLGRLHEPRHEILTLDDYRARHAQYRTDASLQAVTAKMPMIPIWDDHESSNDAWKDGAENHQPSEGDWSLRKAAAIRAYYEWMPVRDPKVGRAQEALFRAFEWGDLLTLVALETRLFARGKQVIIEEHFDDLRTEDGRQTFISTVLNDSEREILGQAQQDFIIDTLKASKAANKPWRLLANQVLMGKLNTPDLKPYVPEEALAEIEKQWDGIRDFVELSSYGLPVYPDSWDGYPVARKAFYKALKDNGITDIVVMTGDSHEFWVNDLSDSDVGKVGIEFGTSSVSSETLGAFLGDATEDYALLMTQANEDVRYYNPVHQGYMDLMLSKDRGKMKFIGVDTVLSRDYSVLNLARFSIRPTRSSVKVTRPRGLNLKQRALFSGLG